ncbi:MAG: sodium:solute symporter family transporter, partial [Pyrinomonadaceae bacterium]
LATLGKMTDTMQAMPMFLATFVPVGITGLCVAAMLAADMSTDSSYMLTWGSVIYNDILAPFRKKKWSEKKGLLINRMIVALIGIFLLIYGLWYPLSGDLWKYLGITGTIYLASISIILISACYWKRANSWGAFAAIIVAAVIPISYLVLEINNKQMADAIGGYTAGVSAYVLAAVAMVVGSLLQNSIQGERV